jgi:hypothetical protein
VMESQFELEDLHDLVYILSLYYHFNILTGCEIVQLKPGGSILEKGKKISLVVKSPRDLSRDVIKVCSFFMLLRVAYSRCIVSCILARLVHGLCG